MLYLSITNKGGQIEKVMDEDLASWDPYWSVVNAWFEEFLSSVPGLKELRGVKFSVCDGNHQRQAWVKANTWAESREQGFHFQIFWNYDDHGKADQVLWIINV